MILIIHSEGQPVSAIRQLFHRFQRDNDQTTRHRDFALPAELQEELLLLRAAGLDTGKLEIDGVGACHALDACGNKGQVVYGTVTRRVDVVESIDRIGCKRCSRRPQIAYIHLAA